VGRERWKDVKEAIAGRISAGELQAGTRLPIETDLCREYGVGRHSLRLAIRALALEGRLKVVQGNGTFIRDAPRITYRIGRRTRFRRNLLEQGLTPSGEHILNELRRAPGYVARELGLAPDAIVHRVLRRGLADGVPISLGIAWHPADLFPDLGERRAAGVSVTEIYRDHGIDDYFRKRTTIFTRCAEPEESALLDQHPESPVLVVSKADVARDGRVIGYAQSVWAGARVSFTLEGERDLDV
jgi:GntR family phosphonate transport system transcriptional regulator